MICRRELDDKKETYKTNVYNFQGQLARKKRWFDIDHGCLKETREPDFYLKIYQAKFRGDNTQKYQKFGVPICNAKMTKKYSSTQKHH